jgi:hypothetical protein
MRSNSKQLDLPTNRTVAGPYYRGDSRVLIVEYDCEQDDGSIRWGAVHFSDVLEFRFQQAACCVADDVLDSNELQVVGESPLLRAVVERWKDSIGWQEWQQKQGGSGRFKHYKLYFDDAGCIDVIAGDHVVPTTVLPPEVMLLRVKPTSSG